MFLQVSIDLDSLVVKYQNIWGRMGGEAGNVKRFNLSLSYCVIIWRKYFYLFFLLSIKQGQLVFFFLMAPFKQFCLFLNVMEIKSSKCSLGVSLWPNIQTWDSSVLCVNWFSFISPAAHQMLEKFKMCFVLKR